MTSCCAQSKHIHSVSEETFHLHLIGLGSPTPFQEAEPFSHMLYVVGVATATDQFGECQSAGFESLLHTSSPTEHMSSTLSLTLLSTDHLLHK